jgi:phosphate starvation-inducible PhoH-like protein
VVAGIPGIEVVHFNDTDVVRHPLVQRIIVAYERRAAAKLLGESGTARADGSAAASPRPATSEAIE